MPVDSSANSEFRISLKWLLIALAIVGTGAGLLGRTFFRDPNLFRAAMMVLSTAVPFFLAVATILRVGVRTHRRGLVAWGLTLGVIPFAGFGVLALASSFMGSAPGGLGVLTTSQIINKRLPSQIDEPWVWQELERRLAGGKLKTSDADAAVAALTKHMVTTKPGGWDEPLSWQRTFLRASDDANLVSTQKWIELSDAFYGKPKLEPLPRLRSGSANLDLRIEFGSTWADHSGLPYKLVWSVKRLSIDGKPVEFDGDSSGDHSWYGRHRGNLKPGKQELTIEIEAAYIEKDKLVGIDINRLPANRWPRPAKRWKQTLTAPLEVFATQDTIVKLTTDPQLDPRKSNAIEVERIVIQPQGQDKTKVVLKVKTGDVLPTPISFDVGIRVGEQDVHVGHTWAIRQPNRGVSGGSNLQEEIEPLDPSVTTADVYLVPNPLHIEEQPDVEVIWGKPIVLRGVPLERFDLPEDE